MITKTAYVTCALFLFSCFAGISHGRAGTKEFKNEFLSFTHPANWTVEKEAGSNDISIYLEKYIEKEKQSVNVIDITILPMEPKSQTTDQLKDVVMISAVSLSSIKREKSENSFGTIKNCNAYSIEGIQKTDAGEYPLVFFSIYVKLKKPLPYTKASFDLKGVMVSGSYLNQAPYNQEIEVFKRSLKFK